MKKALLVIDPQYDYMSDGKFPLWESQTCVTKVLDAIDRAKAKDYPVAVLKDACTTVSEPIHLIALTSWVPLIPNEEI